MKVELSRSIRWMLLISCSFLLLVSGNSVLAEDSFNMGESENVETKSVNQKARQSVKISPQKDVAVAEIQIGHPTAKLVYKPEVVRDIITTAMTTQGSYSVIDWSRLSAVLFRRNLEWSDVVKEKNQLKEIKDVLLNDYFLVGSVSAYSDRWEYQTGAFSKSKTQIVNIQLDLFLKDAITNEIISSARVKTEKRKEVSQSLGFGASGGSDQTMAIEALSDAADKVADELAVELQKALGKGEKR